MDSPESDRTDFRRLVVAQIVGWSVLIAAALGLLWRVNSIAVQLCALLEKRRLNGASDD